MPLNGLADPEVAPRQPAWGGEENAHLGGQVTFVDGGCDVVVRIVRSESADK